MKRQRGDSAAPDLGNQKKETNFKLRFFIIGYLFLKIAINRSNHVKKRRYQVILCSSFKFPLSTKKSFINPFCSFVIGISSSTLPINP